MRLFNQLKFERQKIDSYSGELKETICMGAYVPGVNSGAYNKALHISMFQIRPFKFYRWLKWKFGSKETMVASITLSVEEMVQLRDEINQILRLPFNDNK